MGEHNVEQQIDERQVQAYMTALLEDLRALAFMLEDGRVEAGLRRIGAEQEMFLIDRDLHAAPISLDVLKKANDSRLTTEIARFNLEANMTPLHLTGRCFSEMESLPYSRYLYLDTHIAARSLSGALLYRGVWLSMRSPFSWRSLLACLCQTAA